MARNIFLVSDTHFSHTNAWFLFKGPDGSPLRPFTSNEEMDETMVKNWNSVVRVEDHVYHLGDVVINKKALPLLERCNGHKRLVAGNHDLYYDLYPKYFDKVMGVRVFADMICSHIPLKEDSITPRFGCNVHGHLHGNIINNPNYLSVCVEQINYTPISYEDVKIRIAKNRESYEQHQQVIHWPTGKLYSHVYGEVGSQISGPG